MSDPKDVFKRELEDAVRKLAPDLKVEVHVERPKNPEHGDGSLLEFGEAVFREQCASCHEEDARGDDDGFEEVLDICERACRGLLEHVRSRV